MTRKKVKLAFIVNDSARKATYKKRKKGLQKKVDELSTLCGIKACAMVYIPNDPQPEVWPSPLGVQSVLSKFRMMPELEKSKKLVNQETFSKQRILKAKEHVKKQRKENKEQDMTMFMFKCLSRKKVKLAFTVIDSGRKATYKKRKKGLLMKVDELSTLCGIEACSIVYSPYDPQPKVWPSPLGVQSVLSKFRMMPELEKSKKMVNQETFLKHRILKAKDQVKKQRKENKDQEMTCSCSLALLQDISRRMEILDTNPQVMGPGQVDMAASLLEPAPGPAPAPTTSRNEEMALVDQAHGLGMNANTMQRQWFMDLMINGNGDEAIPFGDVKHPMGYLPNLLP